MDQESGSRWNPRRVGRLAMLAVAVVGVYLLVSLGPPWFRAYFPTFAAQADRRPTLAGR